MPSSAKSVKSAPIRDSADQHPPARMETGFGLPVVLKVAIMHVRKMDKSYEQKEEVYRGR